MGKILTLSNVCKYYGSKKVLDNISFSIEPGKIFALLGPNGAGKTTTLECIEGLKNITSGEILINSKPIKPNKTASILGVQLQSSSLPEYITVREAMKLFCLYKKVEPRYDLLQELGLEEKLNTPFSKLSTGQQRKLILALTLCHHPKLIILDEPTASLDTYTRVQLHKLIKAERDRGTAILLASHDMAEVEELADKVAILLNGKIIVQDTPNKIITSSNEHVKLHFKTQKNSLKTLSNDCIYERTESEDYITLKCEDIDTVLKAALAHIQANQDTILDLKVERVSLEERFISLTKGGQA